MGKHLSVTPTDCFIDEPITVTVKQLHPFETVELYTEMRDNFGGYWSAHVMVQADVNGTVDLSKAMPILGSYSTPDAMGLFWSMKRDRFKDNGVRTPLKPLKTFVTLRRNGAVEEIVTVTRHLLQPSLIREDVRENGIVGVFYHHGDKRPRPTLIVLGGSEGGLREGQAALLAAKGFNAFSLAYFGMKGLPSQLVNIPLEYFQNALEWLAHRSNVDTNRIGLVGTSKGGELALLLASLEPKIKAVAAYVPSSVVHMGLGEADNGQAPSSWSLKGKPLPFAFNKEKSKKLTNMIMDQRNAGQMISYREWYRVHAEAASEDAFIPVEKINGAVLVISGGDDQLWPSALFGEQVIERLRRSQFKHSFKHCRYPKAGHAIGYPGMPTTDSTKFVYGSYDLKAGGTSEDNYRAQADAWRKTVAFFKEKL